jgi:hypothetical protein
LVIIESARRQRSRGTTYKSEGRKREVALGKAVCKIGYELHLAEREARIAWAELEEERLKLMEFK